jgi:hypothetical protein
MRARQWTIAAAYHEPERYDIPALPEWRVHRDGCGGIAFTTEEGAFIAAEEPVRVRR